MSVKLPKLYLNGTAAQPMTDKALDFDPVARMALEVYRDTYNPLPTGSVDEWRAFFSLGNFKYLYDQIKKQAKNVPDENEVIEAMMWAYSSVRPRADEMDERRELFGRDITASYVREINKFVVEKMVAEVVSANQQADVYYRYALQGPVDYDKDWTGYDVDTRTRLHASRYNMLYKLPE